MASHIGIVAVSGEGAALCFRTICNEGAELMGPHNHPEVSLHTFPFKLHVEAIIKNDWQAVADLMLDSAKKLASIGAAFAICPDNTAHQAMSLVRPHSPIPWLHIAEEVASEAKRLGYRRVGITGTRSLTSSSLYPDALTALGIEAVRPSTEQQQQIDTIIFQELVYGRFLTKSREYLLEVAASLQIADCDAVILGCTELPILAEGVDPPVPMLDSTRILARAALKRAYTGMH